MKKFSIIWLLKSLKFSTQCWNSVCIHPTSRKKLANRKILWNNWTKWWIFSFIFSNSTRNITRNCLIQLMEEVFLCKENSEITKKRQKNKPIKNKGWPVFPIFRPCLDPNKMKKKKKMMKDLKEGKFIKKMMIQWVFWKFINPS